MQKVLLDEKGILAKIASDDQHAFAILFKFYHKKVYGYALSILHSETAAEEIVQDVFIKLWIKRENLPAIERFAGFLMISARNETLNALKKVALNFKTNQLSTSAYSENDNATENGIHFRETKRLLDEALQKLPPQQKLIYSLCNFEGLKQKDVADKLNISPLTVKSHLREAVKTVRNHMKANSDMDIILFILFFLK